MLLFADGGAGNDVLEASGAANVEFQYAASGFLIGAAGDDLFRRDSASRFVEIDAGAGYDTFRLTTVGAAVYTMPAGLEALTIDAGASTGSKIAGNDLDNRIEVLARSGPGAFRITSGGGDDVVRALDGMNSQMVVDGGSGDDRIEGGDGNDIFNGSSGDDSLYGNVGQDFLKGDSGRDKLYGAADADILYGGTEADLIVAGDGDDIINADGGVDTIDPGLGKDNVSGGSDDDLDTVTYASRGAADGAIRVDATVYPATDSAGRRYALVNGTAKSPDGVESDQLIAVEAFVGTRGDDVLHLNVYGVEASWTGITRRDDPTFAILGGDGDDVIEMATPGGLAAFHSIAARADGGAGDDVLRASGQALAGDVMLAGGDGDDRLEGSVAADLLRGEAGDDTLYGTSGDDTLEGGEGTDRLNGGDGDDLLDGGGGRDYFDGGPGTDTARRQRTDRSIDGIELLA